MTGWRANLRELSKLVHEVGAILIADAVQHVGAIKLDAKYEGVDVICSGGEKRLSNTFIGSGFFYVSNRIIGELDPGIYELKNAEPPTGGWSSYWPDPGKDP